MFKTVMCSIAMLLMANACLATEIYGHRGAAGLAPENTLIAYQKAFENHVDVIDMDVGITKDGVVVVYHDMTLNPHITRQTNGTWITATNIAVNQLSLKQLKQYNVGKINPSSQYSKVFPYQTPADAQVPTLQEVIRFAKEHAPSTRFQIEIKTDPRFPELSPSPEVIVPAIVKVLREEQVASVTEVHSFDWRNLYLLEKLAPEVIRSFITEATVHTPDDLTWTAGPKLTQELDSFPKLVHALGGDIWCPKFQDVTKADVEKAHDLGLKVNVWSVDEPADMLRMLSMGVDGIITNRPDILHNLINIKHLAAYK